MELEMYLLIQQLPMTSHIKLPLVVSLLPLEVIMEEHSSLSQVKTLWITLNKVRFMLEMNLIGYVM